MGLVGRLLSKLKQITRESFQLTKMYHILKMDNSLMINLPILSVENTTKTKRLGSDSSTRKAFFMVMDKKEKETLSIQVFTTKEI